ncbi:MAG: glycosyltransferase family 9 protein [Weeksellaceae bacterium]
MKPTHLLVFRLSSLGDVAMCVPVIMTALAQNPTLKIDFVAPQMMHDFFPDHPRLKLITFDKKKTHEGLVGIYRFFSTLDISSYDAMIDLHDVLRSQILKVLFKFKGIKTVSVDKGRKEKKALVQHNPFSPLKLMPERYADTFRRLGLEVNLKHQLTDFHSLKVDKTNAIGIAPFAAHPGKMYDITKMKEVVLALQKKYSIKIFGSKQDLDSIESWEEMHNVSFVKESSFADELKVIKSLQVMVSMDSANMHLASLVGVPVISIWGVTHPYAGFLGYGQSEDLIVQDETLPWRPTSIFGHQLGPADNPNGLQQISPQQIIEKVNSVI